MKRATGDLQIAGEYAQVLRCIRRDLAIEKPAEVSLGDLEDVESIVGPIPDDLLSLYLATGQSLRDLVSHSDAMDNFYQVEEVKSWRQRFDFSGVPFDWTYSEEGPLCASRDTPSRIACWDLRKASYFSPDFVDGSINHDAAAYCRWKYAAVDFDVAAADRDFVPRIVDQARSETRRVAHPKFGGGVVLRELDGGKLEIHFDDGSTRVLLARFFAGT